MVNHFIQFQPRIIDNKYLLYKKEAEKIKNIIFCGRLAEYQYYNMDQVVANTLKVFESEFK